MLFPDLGELVLCTELLGSRVDLRSGSLNLKLRCFTHDSDGGGYIGDLDMKTNVTDLLASVLHLASDQERHGFVDTPTWILRGPWFQ
jgi:hypothetical protein